MERTIQMKRPSEMLDRSRLDFMTLKIPSTLLPTGLSRFPCYQVWKISCTVVPNSSFTVTVSNALAKPQKAALSFPVSQE